MAGVVKSMDATLRSMNLEKVSSKEVPFSLDVPLTSFQDTFF
jgi:hypothetical protein